MGMAVHVRSAAAVAALEEGAPVVMLDIDVADLARLHVEGVEGREEAMLVARAAGLRSAGGGRGRDQRPEFGPEKTPQPLPSE